MDKIVPPVTPGMDGPVVENLQDALRALLERGQLAHGNEDLRKALLEGLAKERGSYRDATTQAVTTFQQERKIEPREEKTVDDLTAAALNAVLEELGLLDGQAAASEPPRPAVSGRVTLAQGGPAQGAVVSAYHEADKSGPVRLGIDTVDAEGLYAIRYERLPGVDRVELRVSVATADGRVTSAPVISGARDVETVDVVVAVAAAQAHTVRGTVASPGRPALAGLAVSVVDRNAGGDVELAHVSTDERGRYVATFGSEGLRGRGKVAPDLQVRVRSGSQLLGESEVRYDASGNEVLDVALPASSSSPAAEHAVLTASLATRFNRPLRELKESDGRRDVTYLANKTGWDARAVAMAALADQLSRLTTETGASLAAPLYYALLRAGLPAAPEALFAVDPGTVERAWDAAIEARVIDATAGGPRAQALATFRALAASRALGARVVEGASTLKDLIAPVLPNQADQLQFAGLRAQHKRDRTALWNAVRTAFGATRAARLQLDGQLATLTLNNAPLIAQLHAQQGGTGLTSTLDLARRGYFTPQAWAGVVGQDVPAGVPGDSDEERRSNYRALLAAQVRVSFPTQSVAEMVRTGDLAVTDTAATRNGVYQFLSQHQQEFVIGAQPVEQFAARTGAALTPAVAEAITRLHCVYQLTPTDEAMAGLLANGIDSAAAAVRYERSEFVAAFADALGGAEAAELTHAKAEQISTAVQALVLDYVTTSQAPQIGTGEQATVAAQRNGLDGQNGRNGHGDARAAVAAVGDVIAMPTLETLLGSTSYCSCDHCGSVLSPAAYLVDLLEFLDRPEGARGGKANPLAVLLERRPDLEHLPLSCENTNTRMPYVDLVNETLDHLVAHDLSIEGYEGHDTEGATADELLASPQNVDTTATGRLGAALFPPPLPYDHALEGLRAHLETLESPLWRTMADLRADERLERETASGYGWRDVLMERLGLSREEHRLLTDRAVVLEDLAGLPDGMDTEEAIDGLKGAQAFCRRAGISYEELVALLSTRFVNPHAHLLPRLERLGVPFTTLAMVGTPTLTDAEFRALLPAGLNPAAYDGDVVAWVKASANRSRYMSVVVLEDRGDGTDPCSIEGVELRRTNPATTSGTVGRLQAIDFVRMLRFIRLWRKLGWSMEQVDAALVALTPAANRPTGLDPQADLQALDAGVRTALARLGVAHLFMDRLDLRPERDLYGVLALWADLDTQGPSSPYARLLLESATLPPAPAFADDGYGRYLADPAARLLPHAETLRAAFGLTGDELDLIVADLGFGSATPLSLGTVTAVHRRGWLARALGTSVRELLEMVRSTGLDPFAAPDIVTPAPAPALDPVLPPCLLLIDLVEAVRATDLRPAEVLYLLWNRDLSGRSAPESAAVLDLTRRLRASFDAIEADLAVVADPTGEITRTKMALAYDAATVDAFFGLLNGTAVSSVPYDHPSAELAPAIVTAGNAQGEGRLAYDDVRKRLSFGGQMLAATRDGLKAVTGVAAAFRTAIDQLFADSTELARGLFARYPELAPLHDTFVPSAAPIEARRTALLAAILPAVGRQRRRQQVLDAATAETGVAPAFATTLLQDPVVLSGAAVGSPAASDLEGAATHGLSAAYYWRSRAMGTVDRAADAVPTLEFRPGAATSLPTNGATLGEPISAVWSGYLEAPTTGDFGLSVEADAGASVSLTIAGRAVTLTPDPNDATVRRNTVPVPLTAGSPTPITVKVEGVEDVAVVRWRTTGLGWEVIPSRFLYSETLVGRLRSVYVRLFKAVSLATGLRLTPRELVTLTTHTDERIGTTGWLNALPVTGTASAATAAALGRRLATLLSFVEMRAAISPDDERLLDVLRDPTAELANGEKPLETVTGWSGASLDALLARMGRLRSDLARPAILRRVHQAFRPLQAINVSAASLLPAVTNAPGTATTAGLQRALRARYAEADWLDVVKSINDRLRASRRDASVAFVLHQLGLDPDSAHIDTPERLFEYVLMDVQMAPCMETTRVRHALSSVQLFVERCARNLEPRVAPAAIRMAQWEWMKRYRVWEANRKVFLWPENWLDEELRDNQSPPFKETMAALLQSDITDDAAARALGGYLLRLEEVAKLEPCGIHVVERDPGVADDIVHLVARTSGGARKHFYRRREGGSWTPWEHVKLDIEDTPVIPVVWGGRTFLFWLKVVKEARLEAGTAELGASTAGAVSGLTMAQVKTDMKNQAAESTKVRVGAVLCWSELVEGTWTPAKTSDVERPSSMGTYDAVGSGAFDRSSLRLYSGETDEGLCLWTDTGASFLLYNTHSLPARFEDITWDVGEMVVASPRERVARVRSGTTLVADYVDSAADVSEEREILTLPIGGRVIDPANRLAEPWVAPLVLEDRRHVFYVRTTHKAVSIAESTWHAADVTVHVEPNVSYVIPELLEITDGRKPDPLGPIVGSIGGGTTGPRGPLVNPVPDERQVVAFVTEDALITTGLASVSTVVFDGVAFGMSGQVPDRALDRNRNH